MALAGGVFLIRMVEKELSCVLQTGKNTRCPPTPGRLNDESARLDDEAFSYPFTKGSNGFDPIFGPFVTDKPQLSCNVLLMEKNSG